MLLPVVAGLIPWGLFLQKKEKAAVKEGKKVFFPKRSDKKRQELVR